MAKLIAALIIGLALGAGAVLLVSGLTGETESISPVPRTPDTPPDALITTRTPASRPQVKSLADIDSLPSEFERSAALYARLQSADADTVETLLDEAEGLTNPGRVKQVIYSRYVQLDPRAALDRLRDEKRGQQLLIRTTISAVASFDLDAALAFIDTLGQPLQVQSTRNILDSAGVSDARKKGIAKRFGLERYLWQLQASRQAKHDPAGAWQTALATETGSERREMIRGVADTWFETDPLAALSAVASLDAADRRRLQSRLVQLWASQDPDAALEWALAQPGSEDADPLRQVAGVIANHSPREMFELVGTLEPPRRDRVAKDVLFAWVRTDPEPALDAFVAMKNAAHLLHIGFAIIGSWANEDPQAAFEWIQAQKPSPMRSAWLASTLADLGRSDPARALTLAGEIDGMARRRAIASVLGSWADDDPRAAAAWLDASGGKTAAAVLAVARPYADLDPEGAFEWLQDQSVEAQGRGLATVVRQMAAESPDSALRLIERIGDSSVKQGAKYQLISTWVETDPQAAVLAIARMGDSMSQRLYHHAFQEWSRFDPVSATASLDQIPPSHRDGAIQGMVQQAAFTDPDLAEQLFDRLKGDEARRGVARMLFDSLREVDPERAERYRELSGVTDQQHIPIYR